MECDPARYGALCRNLLLVMAYGEARLWFAPAAENTVRVAGVIPVDFRAKQAEMMAATTQDWQAFRRMAQERFPSILMPQSVKRVPVPSWYCGPNSLLPSPKKMRRL